MAPTSTPKVSHSKKMLSSTIRKTLSSSSIDTTSSESPIPRRRSGRIASILAPGLHVKKAPNPASVAPKKRRQQHLQPLAPPVFVPITAPNQYQFPTSLCNWLRHNMKHTKRKEPRLNLRGSATDFDYLLHYDEVKCTVSLRTDPADNRPHRYPGPNWDPFLEETKFFLRVAVELPSTAGFPNIFKLSPTVVLATYQGPRDSAAAPDWLDMAAVSRVFWQPCTLMLKVLATSARLEFNAGIRDEIYDWTRCVSRVTLDSFAPPLPKPLPIDLAYLKPDPTITWYVEPTEARSKLLRVNYNQITKAKHIIGSRTIY